MSATIILHPASIKTYDNACDWSKDMIRQGYDVYAVFGANGAETVEARPMPQRNELVHRLPLRKRPFLGFLRDWRRSPPPGAA